MNEVAGAGHARDMGDARDQAFIWIRMVAGMARSYGKKAKPNNDRENGYA